MDPHETGIAALKQTGTKPSRQETTENRKVLSIKVFDHVIKTGINKCLCICSLWG